MDSKKEFMLDLTKYTFFTTVGLNVLVLIYLLLNVIFDNSLVILTKGVLIFSYFVSIVFAISSIAFLVYSVVIKDITRIFMAIGQFILSAVLFIQLFVAAFTLL